MVAPKDLPLPGTEFVPPRLSAEDCVLVGQALRLLRDSIQRQCAKHPVGTALRSAYESERENVQRCLSFFGG